MLEKWKNSSWIQIQIFVGRGNKKFTSFLSHTDPYRVALISVSLALSQTPAYTTGPQIWG